MRVERSELEAMFRTWNDVQLYDALHRVPCELSEEAEAMARAEFDRRGVTAAKLQREREALVPHGRRATEGLDRKSRVNAMLWAPYLLGIPAREQWRRYREQGEFQKAKDLARWSWYGIVFHAVVVFGLLLLMILGRELLRKL